MTSAACPCSCGACRRSDCANCSAGRVCARHPADGYRGAEVRAMAAARRLERARSQALRAAGPWTRERQWDRTVELARADQSVFEGERWDGWFLGRMRRSTRHFLAGDLALGWWSNGGGERTLVSGRSSRGRDVRGLYVQHARHASSSGRPLSYARRQRVPDWQQVNLYESGTRHESRCPLEVLELPRRLGRLSPADAAVRAYVLETLLAGDAARPVGESSRAPSSRSQGDPP